MEEIHILITGVGRRIELIQAYRQAALCLSKSLKIYGADSAGTAPALAFCDFERRVCGMKEPDYISDLIKICQEDHINVIIPTIDTDLLILSENKKKFESIGTKVLISDTDKILVCRDKNNTGEFFERCGLKAPKTYNDFLSYPGPYPCFIKPKDGSSSINAYKVENQEELSVYASQIEDYIIQPYISGKEYTIDIFCDFDGNPIYITPRERLQVRAGEVLKTRISNDQIMIEQATSICSKFKPCGPLTVQLIQDEKTNENYYIEINPRYGGGSPLSIKAGARSPEALLRLLSGENLGYVSDCTSENAIYSRFDQSVCIQKGKNNHPIKGVIFDLDDTLYSEKQYVRSGYKKIAEYLGNDNAEEKMWDYFLNGEKAIDKYLIEIGNIGEKENCLKIYREHIPDISLYEGAIELIRDLKNRKIKVGIITDGRPIGQRNKIEALELDKEIQDIIITDELGGTQFRKPNDISYRIIQNRWAIPFENIVYIGDNINKDFQACNQLGMNWIHCGNCDGLYNKNKDYVSLESLKKILF